MNLSNTQSFKLYIIYAFLEDFYTEFQKSVSIVFPTLCCLVLCHMVTEVLKGLLRSHNMSNFSFIKELV
jgi:hypothetical protein